MPLRPLHPSDVATNIRTILDAEGKVYDEPFVYTMSLLGGGSLRDVQQLLDQVIILAGNDSLSVSLLEEAVGVVSTERYKDLASILINKDSKYAIDIVEEWYNEGVDLQLIFMVGIPNLMRDFMVYLSGSLSDKVYLYSGLSGDSLSRNLTLSVDDVKMINKEWEITYPMIKSGIHTKVIFEMFMTKICV